MKSIALAVVLACTVACSKTDAPKPEPQTSSAKSDLRAAAPPFELKDLDGKTVRLADFKGKTVVLEWFNPQCPFVKNAHTKGSLVQDAKTWTDKGVVWLSINSSADGKQGSGLDVNKAGKQTYAMQNPILLDPTGSVGKAYGATNTPNMFVVDGEGKIAYRGAIDNSPDGEGQSPQGGKLINYVDQALGELGAGKPVSVPETKAYGCSVKYDS